MSTLRDLYYSFRYDLTRNYWLITGKNSPFYGHALMFHHVTDEQIIINKSCLCRVDDFKRIIENYKNAGFDFVSVSTALEYLKDEKERRFAVVTFDDIPDNVYTNAYPFLKENNIPFIVFVTRNYIDYEDYISLSHLHILNDDPLCEIGAHSMTHPLLRQVKNSDWEINQSKIELEHIIGKKVKYFAYPYGRYSAISKKVMKQAKESGFECAFCTVSAPLIKASSSNLFFLPRIVPSEDGIIRFSKQWSFIGVLRSLAARALKSCLALLKGYKG